MTPPARFWLHHAVLPLAGFLALAVLFETTDLDYVLSDPFYDFTKHRWTFRQAWWANELVHSGGKYLVILVALSGLSVFGLSALTRRLRAVRRASLYLFLVIGLSTGIVGLAKAASPRHCPWDVDRYGGYAPHLGLFERAPPGTPRGRCFPAAHAASGFSLLGLYFVFRGRRRRLAMTGLATGLLLGSAYGFGQMVRGAHFASHNLWSAAVCWGVALLLFRLAFRGDLGGGTRARRGGASPDGGDAGRRPAAGGLRGGARDGNRA